MKHRLIKNDGGKSLLIFFAGWSCEPQTMKSFTPKNWDVLVLYDYCDLEFPIEALAVITEYEKFALAAHSFGVWVANYHYSKFPKLENSIAICGTLFPVDDQYGISQRIFDLTLRSIKNGGIEKFNEKMCGDNISNFTLAEAPFEEQYEALANLGKWFRESPAAKEDVNNWKMAVICMKDQIFPVDNLIRYWGESDTEVLGFKNLPHFPFSSNFSQFISSIL